MAKGGNQKLKLLYIAKYFMENTDENHKVTTHHIVHTDIQLQQV